MGESLRRGNSELTVYYPVPALLSSRTHVMLLFFVFPLILVVEDLLCLRFGAVLLDCVLFLFIGVFAWFKSKQMGVFFRTAFHKNLSLFEVEQRSTLYFRASVAIIFGLLFYGMAEVFQSALGLFFLGVFGSFLYALVCYSRAGLFIDWKSAP